MLYLLLGCIFLVLDECGHWERGTASREGGREGGEREREREREREHQYNSQGYMHVSHL